MDQQQSETDAGALRGVLSGARFILIARRADPGALIEVAGALRDAGLRYVEVTLDADEPYALIATLRSRYSDLIVGAGTVLRPEQLQAAADAGAAFAVSPHSSPALLEAAQRLDMPYVPGAFTPSEIVAAWEAGAAMVKVFPIATLGASFLKQLRGPLPHIPLVVTGGVTLVNALEYRRAGADAVGMGSEILDRWRTGLEGDRAALLEQVATVIAHLA